LLGAFMHALLSRACLSVRQAFLLIFYHTYWRESIHIAVQLRPSVRLMAKWLNISAKYLLRLIVQSLLWIPKSRIEYRIGICNIAVCCHA